MKTVLFVPGFPHDLHTLDYQETLDAIRNCGYNVRFVPIHWARTVVGDWVHELEKVYDGYDPSDTILAGFSFGAVTALVAAAKRLPAETWLFSLSPTLADDRELTQPDKNTLRTVGRRRLRAFAKLDYQATTRNVTCKTLIFYGEREGKRYPELKRRCEITATRLANAKLIIVPGAGHDVAHAEYIATIEKNIC
jgi:pimeloyl-ACP methyl ester carboxylesterase